MYEYKYIHEIDLYYLWNTVILYVLNTERYICDKLYIILFLYINGVILSVSEHLNFPVLIESIVK